MHPSLIKANIALFKGERAETLRFLQDYVSEFGFSLESDPDAPLVMWLDAQAQTDRNERIRRLQILVGSALSDNHYSQLARNYLNEETRLGGIHVSQPAQPRRTLFFALLGGMLLVIVIALIVARPQQPPEQTPPNTALPEPTALNLPDRSQPLVADSFTARYPRGILQILAVEEDSKRVVNTREQTLAIPVEGGRFYALNLSFECRGGICEHPPEATVALQLDNGDLIEPKSEVSIAGERLMQAVALGRSTAGWVIFEVPLVSPVKALVISDPEDNGAFDPIVINLSIP